MPICLYNNILPPPINKQKAACLRCWILFLAKGGIQECVLAIIFPVHESFFDDRFVHKPIAKTFLL